MTDDTICLVIYILGEFNQSLAEITQYFAIPDSDPDINYRPKKISLHLEHQYILFLIFLTVD